MTNDVQHDNNAQLMIDLIQKHHNGGEVRDLYFRLEIDRELVPERSNKRDFVEFLILHMARRNKQKVLIDILKEDRPHLNWPDNYTIQFQEVQFESLKKPIHIEQYVETQNITYNQTAQQRKPKAQRQKARRISKEDKLVGMSYDLYNQVFKYTKSVIWLFLGLLLIWVSFILFFYVRDMETWNYEIFNFSVFYVLGIIVIFRVVF
ncbi:MAG: hypothetical protein GY943_12880, partial [Chloroflexi bacterium]|nr:hypothetical protein [Chloroflexota bacterium]